MFSLSQQLVGLRLVLAPELALNLGSVAGLLVASMVG